MYHESVLSLGAVNVNVNHTFFMETRITGQRRDKLNKYGINSS